MDAINPLSGVGLGPLSPAAVRRLDKAVRHQLELPMTSLRSQSGASAFLAVQFLLEIEAPFALRYLPGAGFSVERLS